MISVTWLTVTATGKGKDCMYGITVLNGWQVKDTANNHFDFPQQVLAIDKHTRQKWTLGPLLRPLHTLETSAHRFGGLTEWTRFTMSRVRVRLNYIYYLYLTGYKVGPGTTCNSRSLNKFEKVTSQFLMFFPRQGSKNWSRPLDALPSLNLCNVANDKKL